MTITGRSSVFALTCVLAVACGGKPVGDSVGSDPATGCAGRCLDVGASLSVADVEKVVAQGVAEATARGASATLAVVDRVGNVLAVFRMGDKQTRVVTLATRFDGNGQATRSGGLEGIRLPTAAAQVSIDDQAAITKAITAAYVSSEGNAFSTRTVSQIIQEHFNPQEQRVPAGPLFGVQFSQLACSDLMGASTGTATGVGPQRSPLGLSGDPGGFPLYKNGTPVGGVGVIADGRYGLAGSVFSREVDVDEAIAYAASFGFAAPVDRRADRITADGKTLRFSNVEVGGLRTVPAAAPALATVSPSVGALVPVTGYSDGHSRAGTSFGASDSGIRPDREGTFPGQDAFVLVDSKDGLRFPARAGTDAAALGGGVLSQVEVQTLLRSALVVANRARAQIRRPLGSQARVTVSVCDTEGAILGVVSTRDAPVFGIDVSLQKARSAAFVSSATAGSFLQSLPDGKVLDTSGPELRVSASVSEASYLGAARTFFGDPGALGDGRIAYSVRALGNIARPFFPDGIDGTNPGAFSKPAGDWSVLSTGLQLDLSINAILQHVLFVAGGTPTDVASGCVGVELAVNPLGFTAGAKSVRLGNGLQIFPGGVPIYRSGTLIGAIGVSGDGVDQDDLIAFLAVNDASAALAGAIGNAPVDRRADTLTPRGVRLRYVQCPQAAFLDDAQDQHVCDGK